LLRKDQLGVQLYTVRDYLTDNRQTAETLKKIYDIGYRVVENVGFVIQKNIELNKLLEDAALACRSSHELFEDMESHPDVIVRKLRGLECKNVISAIPLRVEFDNLKEVENLTRRLNATGKIYKDEGITLHYHNHSMEFAKFNRAMTGYDYLFNETDARYVQFQPDVYWIQLGGGNPESWIKKLKGRMPTIHLKDYKVAGGTPENPIKHPQCTELGEGNLDLKAIVALADASGCELYILDIDENWVNDNPFESMEESFKYLAENFNL
jgi:sugar phosphate isomerase/epimerase